MKKILLLLSVFALFSCEQEELDGVTKIEKQSIVTSRAATIADFDPIDQLIDIPVNIVNMGNTQNQYLSCVQKGDKVDLYKTDDGSMRQRWYVTSRWLVPNTGGLRGISLVGGNSYPYACIGLNGNIPHLLRFNEKPLPVPCVDFIPVDAQSFYISMYSGLMNAELVGYLQPSSQNSSSLTINMNKSKLGLWKIVPIGEFEIMDIQYVKTIKDELDIQNLRVYTRTFMNEQGEMSQKHTLTINETLTNKSQFSVAEGVSVKVSSGLKIGIPKVADLNFGTDSNKSWTYTTVEEETKTATVQDVHEVEIPPYSNYRINVYVVNYKMNISYVATLRNVETKQIFKIKGKWSGQLCDINDITYETVNLGTGKIVSTYSRKGNTK